MRLLSASCECVHVGKGWKGHCYAGARASQPTSCWPWGDRDMQNCSDASLPYHKLVIAMALKEA